MTAGTGDQSATLGDEVAALRKTLMNVQQVIADQAETVDHLKQRLVEQENVTAQQHESIIDLTEKLREQEINLNTERDIFLYDKKNNFSTWRILK